MATTAQWFAQSGGALIGRLWVAQVMHVALMKPTYVPDIDGQLRYSDVSAQEVVTGGGYTAGGMPIMNRSFSYDSGNNETNLIGDDVLWGPGATFTCRYGIVYEQATTDKYLWELLDFGQQFDIVNGYFAVDFTTAVLSVKAGPAV